MSWDDGTHAKVKKIELTYGDLIYSIKVTYEGTTVPPQLHGTASSRLAEFTLDPDEYITALSSYGKMLGTQEAIMAMTFTTNKKTYGPYGNKFGSLTSTPEATGKQIAGFFGTSGSYLNSINVHYAPVPTGTGTGTSTGSGTGTESGTDGSETGTGTGTSTGSGTGTELGSGTGTGGSGPGSGTGTSTNTGSGSGSGAEKLDAQGGTGGTVWDDGSDHDGVTKIYIRQGALGIQYVKFDYVKAGQPITGAMHGVQGSRGSDKDVVIIHPDEYLISVNGWYDSSNVIQGIQFKTNKTTSENFGYELDGDGTEFTLQVQDKKIIGFHGFASNHLNSIGAYFVPLVTTTPSVPPKKLKAEGGEGTVWDDGSHDNVKKVYAGQGDSGVAAVMFEYTNGSQVVIGAERGKSTPLGFEGFELESGEYITSVQGTYDKIYGHDNAILTMLIFKTSKNKTWGPYGLEGSTRFVLKEEGYKIVGFHGRAGENINAIGAYLAPIGTIPIIPATPGQKLEGIGSDGGTSWDDGAYDGVKKVYVGQADSGISAVKFEYNKGAQVVFGDEHGEPTLLDYEEFVIDYPSEYITQVDGTFDKIFGSDGTVINMLRFKTNKKTSIPYGLEAGTPFVFKKEGHKIVGFHGSVGNLLNKFGVHVLPITN
ncbi:unnamed protein product [Arabis nemorensis]|uniref:Jacalin-type lectin domain-containing protein n=1 Tax=Arabis nemorensis TaxID=586526 RepID=A0A565B8K8_9BRAS|nr:unnamed protein product [Arabis nemorensis]